jgi:hypothetical protein
MVTHTISFKCAKCRGDKFVIPKNPKPNDMVVCANPKCGASRRFRYVEKQAIANAKKAVEKAVRDAFRKPR